MNIRVKGSKIINKNVPSIPTLIKEEDITNTRIKVKNNNILPNI